MVLWWSLTTNLRVDNTFCVAADRLWVIFPTEYAVYRVLICVHLFRKTFSRLRRPWKNITVLSDELLVSFNRLKLNFWFHLPASKTLKKNLTILNNLKLVWQKDSRITWMNYRPYCLHKCVFLHKLRSSISRLSATSTWLMPNWKHKLSSNWKPFSGNNIVYFLLP